MKTTCLCKGQIYKLKMGLAVSALSVRLSKNLFLRFSWASGKNPLFVLNIDLEPQSSVGRTFGRKVTIMIHSVSPEIEPSFCGLDAHRLSMLCHRSQYATPQTRHSPLSHLQSGVVINTRFSIAPASKKRSNHFRRSPTSQMSLAPLKTDISTCTLRLSTSA